VELWEKSDGEHEFGIEPISQALDEDLFLLQMVKETGVPLDRIEDLPDRWKFVVRILWAWQDVERKKPAKRRK